MAAAVARSIRPSRPANSICSRNLCSPLCAMQTVENSRTLARDNNRPSNKIIRQPSPPLPVLDNEQTGTCIARTVVQHLVFDDDSYTISMYAYVFARENVGCCVNSSSSLDLNECMEGSVDLNELDVDLRCR